MLQCNLNDSMGYYDAEPGDVVGKDFVKWMKTEHSGPWASLVFNSNK